MKSEGDSGTISPTIARPTSRAPGGGGSGGGGGSSSSKRTVCDHCRRRRIRCDGHFPCAQCSHASLTCKRDHVPLKRGPKRGHGRVINELRAQEARGKERTSRESSADLDIEIDSGPASAATSVPSSPPDISWNKVTSDPRNAREPGSIFTSDQFQPTSRSYLHLIPQCVDLYYEHIYPIMPLPYMPALRDMIARPMTASEKNYVYALSALTSFHMSGQSLETQGPPSWEVAGRFFLDECISVRQSYDFLEDASLNAVVSSFWLSTSFFEINQSRKSWLYLREALTLALDLGLQDDSTYAGLSPEERLCRQRVFWQLFVTERSFAILRNKPITFKKTPSLPTTRHAYESPDIHSGFLQLISSYVPLDESFVTAWNDGSDPRVSATTYLALQNLLAQPPAFLSRSRASSPSTHDPCITTTATTTTTQPFFPSSPTATAAADDDEPEPPEPTAIQKADLLMTQQWLRLVVWQSSFRQGLLSWAAADPSTHFAFPLVIARRTASILQTLPPSAVEVHGMGIFEKIFEIGSWAINVLAACDTAVVGGPVMGMDFVRGDDVGLLGLGRKAAAVDPLEFFVRTLSASPNSRTQFAERLLLFAAERPGGMRMALSPALSPPGTPGPSPIWDGGGAGTGSAVGSVLGEVVADESDIVDGRVLFDMGTAVPGAVPVSLSSEDVTFSSDAGDLGVGSAETGGIDFGATAAAAVAAATSSVVDSAIDLDMGTAMSDWSGGEISPFGGLESAGAVASESMDFFQDGLDGANSGYSMAGGVYQDQVAPRAGTDPDMSREEPQGYDSRNGQSPRLNTYVYRPADMGNLGVL